ncbi:MAG: FliM/FliN family flagellar motor switch protein, partial [Planctomycetes bacterium]|nr:FliM/FliN family flagellar motor switch protein [Planctomycetota bacterium]
ALSDLCESCDFLPITEIVTGRLPVEFRATEEVCKIGLRVKKADSKEATEAYFLILCEKLHHVVGDRTQAYDSVEEDVADAMLRHVYEIPISVKAQLDSTAFTIEEAMSLGVGDILLLDKKVTDPIDLIVEDRILFRGRPAKSAGKYAVVITETAYDTN